MNVMCTAKFSFLRKSLLKFRCLSQQSHLSTLFQAFFPRHLVFSSALPCFFTFTRPRLLQMKYYGNYSRSIVEEQDPAKLLKTASVNFTSMTNHVHYTSIIQYYCTLLIRKATNTSCLVFQARRSPLFSKLHVAQIPYKDLPVRRPYYQSLS